MSGVQEQYLTERDVAQRLLEVANRLNNSGKVSDALYVKVGATTLTELLATVSQLRAALTNLTRSATMAANLIGKEQFGGNVYRGLKKSLAEAEAALQPSEGAEPQKGE